jgi:hypothetical protein
MLKPSIPWPPFISQSPPRSSLFGPRKGSRKRGGQPPASTSAAIWAAAVDDDALSHETRRDGQRRHSRLSLPAGRSGSEPCGRHIRGPLHSGPRGTSRPAVASSFFSAIRSPSPLLPVSGRSTWMPATVGWWCPICDSRRRSAKTCFRDSSVRNSVAVVAAVRCSAPPFPWRLPS